MVTESHLKHEGELVEPIHSYGTIRDKLISILPENLEPSDFLKLDENKVTSEELLVGELENLISETLCHSMTLESVNNHLVPIIHQLIKQFPAIDNNAKASEEEIRKTIINNFTFHANCGNNFDENKVNKSAALCADKYNGRYNKLPKEMALNLIRNYASTKSQAFQERQLKKD